MVNTIVTSMPKRNTGSIRRRDLRIGQGMPAAVPHFLTGPANCARLGREPKNAILGKAKPGPAGIV